MKRRLLFAILLIIVLAIILKYGATSWSYLFPNQR